MLLGILDYQFSVQWENDLVESTKFWLVQPQNLLIIYGQQNFVDPTKYLVDSNKFFGCFNQIGIFGTRFLYFTANFKIQIRILETLLNLN